jgi:tRNA1(Val) A37 N6-methylase TrmN6
MFDQVDTLRREVSESLDEGRRAQLGQYMTPSRIARYMASLFNEPATEEIALLDAGAGIGSLTAAFLERVQGGWGPVRRIDAQAYEIDPALVPALAANLHDYQQFALGFGVRFCPQLEHEDFIVSVTRTMWAQEQPQFDCVILNPPYKKITSDSLHRKMLRSVGIETVNLYSAFVALCIKCLKPGGELVAIIPRSFCNGPYYKPFRELIFRETALLQIHLFASRTKPFGEDDVLQENLIIHLRKSEPQGQVLISTSADDSFADLQTTAFDFGHIVPPDDPERVIHIPTGHDSGSLTLPPSFSFSLTDLGITVSTGPVVDFRVKAYLRPMPDETTVPLLYPAHFAAKHLDWPKPDFKKSNAIQVNGETAKWLYPTGHYVVVKRFSSKEEKKRIVARIVSPTELPSSAYGFENHLNVFHHRKKGLAEELALGLAVYLNSTLVDQYFRQFNGHTQVNATDLRLLKYPSAAVLRHLGHWARDLSEFDQVLVDQKVSSLA